MLRTLLAQSHDIAASGQCKHLVAIAMALEHVQRVQSDAAGRAQHGDAHLPTLHGGFPRAALPAVARALGHRSSPRRSRPTRNTGAAAVTLSTRSSSPP